MGINWSPLVKDLYQDNYILLLKGIKQDLNGYPYGRLSWLGRINIIKIVILSKVLYVFQALPINIPGAYFKTLWLLLWRFLWKHWGPRVAYKVLVRPKSNGGLSLPDFETYHKAAVLARIVDCLHSTPLKNWVQLEEIISETPLGRITLYGCKVSTEVCLKTWLILQEKL